QMKVGRGAMDYWGQ
nr:immunoglobulin heavy chain junction region [Mus musculus]